MTTYPREAWFLTPREDEVLGVDFDGRLDPDETIVDVITVELFDAAGTPVGDAFLDDEEIAAGARGIRFRKVSEAAPDTQPPGEYRTQIHGLTSKGRKLESLMRDKMFPLLVIVDGLTKPPV